MTIDPYLTFDGTCRQAFDFYRSVFGGEFGLISTFREGPEDMGVPSEEFDRIMHVSLPIGSSVLMGSDSSSTHGPAPVAGTNFAISFSAKNKEHADEVFAALSEGGEIQMPMGDMFWGAYFGLVLDRFSITWQVIAGH